MPTSTPINIKNLIEDLTLISSNNIDIIYDIINHILNNNYINYDFQAALKIIYNNLDDKLSISLKNRQYDLVLKLTSIRQSIDTLETQLNLICNSNTNKNITQNINSTSEITTSSDHANIESLDNNIDICSINDMPLNNTIIAQIITYDLSNDIDFTKKNPKGFIFKNKLYQNITTWKNILIETCKALFKENPILFNDLPYNEDLQGKQNTTYFSTLRTKSTINNRNPIRKPYKIPTSNVYVETNLSANNITSIIKKLLLLYTVSLSDYKILLLEKIPFSIKANTSTSEISKMASSKETRNKYMCIHYDADTNFCKITKNFNCYSAKLNCSNYQQKEDTNIAKDIIPENKNFITNIDNNTSKNSNSISLIEDKSIEKINNTNVPNLKKNTIILPKKPIIYILNSIKTCPCCQKDLILDSVKISFIKNNLQKEKTLLAKKCLNCNKTYILKEVYTSFINNKNINTMNYNFLKGDHLTTSNYSNVNLLLNTIKNNLKPNEQIVFFSDDFSKLTNSLPINFYFNNQFYSLIKWSDILIHLSQKLYIMNPTKFKDLPKKTAVNINGTLHFKIAFDDKVLKKPFKIKNSSLFIDLDLSLIEIQTLINQMLYIYKIDTNLLFIKIKNISSKNFNN